MKRINPKTGKEFIINDIRDDGYSFERYRTNLVRKNGFFAEVWRSPLAIVTKKAYEKSYYSSKKGKVIKTLNNIKTRAKRKGLAFDLDLDYLTDLMTENCPVFGFPLAWDVLHKNNSCGHATFDSPTVDRIDSTKGYIKGNVVWISHKANSIKNSATYEELFKVAEWLKEKTK